MRGKSFLLLGLALLCQTAGLVAGPAWGTPAPAARADAIDDLAAKSDFSGAIGVIVSQRVNVRQFGSAAQASDLAPWRWASVTKQVVAVLVLQQVAKGMIALDAPLTRYLPAFASHNAASITVRQLLRHQTGLPNPDDTAADADAMPAYYLPGYTGNRDPLPGYCAGPVKGAPGNGWSYNNCDYIVAGALLQAVTGKPWQRLVKDRIARPLGLHSVRTEPESGPARPAYVDGKAQPVVALSSFAAAASLQGTVADLLKFDRALMGGKLLPPAQLVQLWDGQPQLGYIALGQWVFTAQLKGCAKPQRIVERRGAIAGVQVRNFILPDRALAVAAFSDRAEFNFGEIWQGAGFSYDLLSLAACQPETP